MPFRDRTPRRLLLELAGIVAVFGTAAFLIWWFTRPPSIHNVRPVGGPNMDISHDARAQWAPSAAIDPADPDILLAGSSDELRSRSSNGVSWSTPLRLPFQAPFQASVAVAPDGDVYSRSPMRSPGSW
jgi:hypothetical protein